MSSDELNIQQYKKMTETPIPKLILGLAAPTILSMLITSIYNLADTFFVGQISTSASGAVKKLVEANRVAASELRLPRLRLITVPAPWPSMKPSA